jgi:DNA-binding XRE family transcriptional regulator
MDWEVRFHPAFDPEFDALPNDVQEVNMTTLTEKIDRLPEARRKKVEERARALIAEEMSLQDLRKARKWTQVRVAKELGINQENVSRIEKRSDLLLSTLSGYVEAMGGTLRLVVEFPDRPPIALTGISALDKEDFQTKP